MKTYYRIILFILVTLCKLLSQPLSISTESLTSKDGLSQNSVVKIFQDSRQFLWFGTFDGINRYDGYSFRVYKTDLDDPSTISGQHFQAMCEDRNGNIWFGSLGGGLNKYNRNTDSFKRFLHDDKNNNSICSNYIREICIDRNANLWIATEGGVDKFNPFTEKFTHFKNDYTNPNSILSDYVTSICEDQNGNIWIGSGYGIDRFDSKTNQFVHYLRTISVSGNIYLDRSKILWFGTGQGIFRYDSKNDKMIQYRNNYFNTSNQSIRCMHEDSQGNFWVAPTTGGLYNFNRNNGRFSQYIDNPSNEINLSKDVVYTIYEDRYGILWCGTAGGGVTKLDFHKTQFTNYLSLVGNVKSLSNNNVYSIIEDEQGFLWISTYGGGFNKFDPKAKTNAFTRFMHDNKNENSLRDNLVYCLLIDKQSILWIGAQSGLEFYDIKNSKFVHPAGYPSISTITAPTVAIFTLTKTSSGEIWIGTYSNGLYIFNPETKKIKNYTYSANNPKSISNNTIRKVFEDHLGNIWIGTDNGLNRFNRSTDEFIKFYNDPGDPLTLTSNNAFSIFEDKAGTLWIGTTVGLNKMIGDRNDNKSAKFIRYLKAEGLPDNIIQAILEDNKGNLWLSTNRGLSKFDVLVNKFINYTEDNGLLSDEFYLNSFHQIKSTGEMIFGGNQGLTIFKPDDIQNDKNIPSIVLTNFTLFNKPVQIGKELDGVVVMDKSITEAKNITLSYKHNVITFEFAALHFASPKNNQYAYYLEGLESSWNYVGNRKFATYANLAPGEYTLRIKASNNSGIWNAKGISLKISVIPPFWQTWWFRLLTGIVLILIYVISYKQRISIIEKRRYELEKLNDQLIIENLERQHSEEKVKEYADELNQSNQTKDKFFSIIAHDLKNPFFILLGFSDLILTEYDELTDEERLFYVEQIKKSAQLSHQLLENLLQWSRSQTGRIEFNPQKIELHQIILENIEFVKASAENKELSIGSKVEHGITVYADPDMVNTIVRNLLTNSIKYSNNGGVINVEAVLKKDCVQVCVSDSGVGMSEKTRNNLFKLDVHQSSEGTANEPGTGLGLLLCKEFIGRHKKEIWAESIEGEGSKFYFTLPVKQ
jgi:ligand-binding sensor domain-containing protein/signal transduction histidine kinase